MPNNVETALDLESLLNQLVTSFTTAAVDLEEAMAGDQWKERDYMYRMPQMRLSIQLNLSYSDKKVKGVFKKSSRESQSALESQIGIDVVAVPRVSKGG